MEPLTDSIPQNLLQLREALSGADVVDLEICSWNQRKVLRARVTIRTGKYADTDRRVGWSFADDSQPYPEYAPHWFHVEGDYNDGIGGASETDHDENGQLWTAWSRPVGATWASSSRSPKKLLRATVSRFWKAVK